MDVAASEFYKDGKYDLDFKSPDDPSRYISPDKLADLYKSFVKDYPGVFWVLSISIFNYPKHSFSPVLLHAQDMIELNLVQQEMGKA